MNWDNRLAEIGITIKNCAVRRVVNEGLDLMEQNHGSESACPKHMHTVARHLLPMMQSAEKLGPILGVELEDFLMPIAWHDTVIEFDMPQSQSDPLGMIKRHRGALCSDQPSGENGNEAVSGRLMVVSMCAAGFSGRSTEPFLRAVEATYPGVLLGSDFKGDPFETDGYLDEACQYLPCIKGMIALLKQHGIDRGPHFFQPHLESPLSLGDRVYPVALAMGFLDLGTCGLASPETDSFFLEGNREYMELHPNLPSHFDRLIAGKTDVDLVQRQMVVDDILLWRLKQTGFVLWQAIRFARILHWLMASKQISEEQCTQLRALFSHYPANVEDALMRALRMQRGYDSSSEAFVALLRVMGYSL